MYDFWECCFILSQDYVVCHTVLQQLHRQVPFCRNIEFYFYWQVFSFNSNYIIRKISL